jgi:N-acetylglucosamine kinase-like BadF-type ATPase
MKTILIADSGSTKTEWCFLKDNKRKKILTQGMSPYFLNENQISDIIQLELLPKLPGSSVDEIFFYGTGCSQTMNANMVHRAIKQHFKNAKVKVEHDLLGAAKALCGQEKGIACILGTGSNSCYFNGKKILKNSPGLGFILGDEGSGAYLGKKVVQYYMYNTFDDELQERFESSFNVSASEILDAVYKKPLPNRYLAGFAIFLAENRGHFMIENIIEDGLNDFFFTHLYKYKETWKLPIHFIGSIAYGFKDVLKDLCDTYELELGMVLKSPMPGLIKYHELIANHVI